MTDIEADIAVRVLRRAVDDLADARSNLDRLDVLCRLQRFAENYRDATARACIDEGATFAEVGRLVGVSREAARQRYPRTQ